MAVPVAPYSRVQLEPSDSVEDVKLHASQEAADHRELEIEVYVISEEGLPAMVRVPLGQTAGQLLVAHAKSYQSRKIPLAHPLDPGSVVQIEHVCKVNRTPCEAHLPGEAKKCPHLSDDSREQLLWKQQGWVAVDEMKLCIQMLSNSYPGKFCPPVLTSSGEPKATVQEVADLIQQVIESYQHVVCIPILTEGHWSPLVAMPYHDKVAVWTTRHQAKIIRDAGRITVGELPLEIFECAFPHRFPADCGFQTIGWFISMSCLDTEFRAITDQLAAHWRMLFHQHVVATQANDVKVTSPLLIGGANALHEDLVTDHGVSQGRSHECADHVLVNMGATPVQKIMKSPQSLDWSQSESQLVQAAHQNSPSRKASGHAKCQSIRCQPW